MGRNRMGLIIGAIIVVLLLIWFMSAGDDAVETTDGADADAVEATEGADVEVEAD